MWVPWELEATDLDLIHRVDFCFFKIPLFTPIIIIIIIIIIIS